MKPKIIWLLVSLFIILAGCQNQTAKPKEKEKKQVLYKGLSSPVYMEKDTTLIHLRDYILYPDSIRKIVKHSHYSFRWNKKNHELKLVANNNFSPIENLSLQLSNGDIYEIPLFRYEKKKLKIVIPASDKFKDLKIKGEMTGWQPKKMTLDKSNWVYEQEVDPGSYQYVLINKGKEMTDPANPDKVSNGMGGYNSIIKIEDNSAMAPVLKTGSFAKNHFSIVFFNQQPEKILVYTDNRLLDKKYIEFHPNEADIYLPKDNKGFYYLRIYAYNQNGRSNDLLIPIKDNKIITDAKELPRTDFHKQIMYFLMVDRFYNGDPSNDFKVLNDTVLPKANYYGGDLSGVIKKMKQGYFDQLGVNTLWLSPITQNPLGAYGLWKNPYTKFSGYHGYWPVSNTKIDFRFGNDSIFRGLLNNAHSKNMNVLLDYVANHVHEENPVYKEHPDWATDLYLPDGTLNTEKWDSHRLTTWFDTFLPTLDFSKPEVIEAMTDSAVYWVKEFPLDGFRHDATKHIQQDFWRTLTWKIKTQVPRPVFQIGETYGSPELIRSYINTGMLDAQFDFNLYDASVAVFAKPEEPVNRLSNQLKESLKYYGHHHLMGNMTGNQDRVRFISYASGDVKFNEDGKTAGWTRNIQITDSTAYDKLAMLHAFNLSIPGVPCIYYGDEIGMPGANDPDNRRMMKFENLTKKEQKLKNEVEKMISLRKNSMALLYGTTEIKTDGDILIIQREYFNDKATSIFNKSDNKYIYKKDTILPHSYKIINVKSNKK